MISSKRSIAPPSLAEKAYDLIEEMIVTLSLSPGTIFTEGELSQQLNIGRTPIREALQRLASDRLVVALPRRGMMVTEINFGDQLTLLETRKVLDRLIAGRVARLATKEQRDDLKHCAIEIRKSVSNDDLSEFMRRDRECDEIMEKACRSPFAIQALAPIHAHCRRFWYHYQGNGDLVKIAELHATLMEKVAEGDISEAGNASDALIEYLEMFTKESVLNL